jgi:UDP-glucose 4-epimerase
MLTHLLASPQLPARTVVIGAGGFVGGAIAKRVAELGGEVAALSRAQVDLLAPDAAQRLASLLRAGDAVVAAAAKAPTVRCLSLKPHRRRRPQCTARCI